MKSPYKIGNTATGRFDSRIHADSNEVYCPVAEATNMKKVNQPLAKGYRYEMGFEEEKLFTN